MLHDATLAIDSGGTIEADYFTNGASSMNVQVCFAAGYEIELADGTTKKIEDFEGGEVVCARAHNKPNGSLQKCKVVRGFENGIKETMLVRFNNGLELRGTKEHPFFVQGKGWLPLGELAVGDVCYDKEQEPVVVKELICDGQAVEVYNVEVEGAHTYYIGKNGQSILVHNTCADPFCGHYLCDVKRTATGMFQTGPKRLVKGLYSAVADGKTAAIEFSKDPVTNSCIAIDKAATSVENTVGRIKDFSTDFYNDPSETTKQIASSAASSVIDRVNYYLDNPEEAGADYFSFSANLVGTKSLPIAKNVITGKLEQAKCKLYRRTCFTEGTQVVVGAEFTDDDVFVQYVTVNIEDIEVGDLVYSYDTVTGEVTQQEVTATFALESDHINYLTIVNEDGDEQVIETTDSHPFWVVADEPDLSRTAGEYVDENGAILYHENLESSLSGYWVEAKDLREGDVFLGANGELSTLVTSERIVFPDGVKVYNFTVDGNHDYFVLAETGDYGQTSILVHNAGPWYHGTDVDSGKDILDLFHNLSFCLFSRLTMAQTILVRAKWLCRRLR